MKDKENPLVSVIIPSFNHSQYILKAIESVKIQTYLNWELIIIDDGSKDNTHQVLQSFPADSRIRIFLNKDNKGQSFRLNQAIHIAGGQYISFLSSDDWYLPTKLEKQVALFNELDESYGCVYSGGYRFFENTGETIEIATNKSMRKGDILKELLLEPFFIYPISPLIKKECFKHYPFDESYMAEGEAIYFKIAMKYKFDYVEEPLVTMRNHGYNIGRNIDKMLEDNIRYREELFQHIDFPEGLQKYKGRVLGEIYKLKGWECIRLEKRYEKGEKILLKAIKSGVFFMLNKYVIAGLVLCTIYRIKKVKYIFTK